MLLGPVAPPVQCGFGRALTYDGAEGAPMPWMDAVIIYGAVSTAAVNTESSIINNEIWSL